MGEATETKINLPNRGIAKPLLPRSPRRAITFLFERSFVDRVVRRLFRGWCDPTSGVLNNTLNKAFEAKLAVSVERGKKMSLSDSFFTIRQNNSLLVLPVDPTSEVIPPAP